MIRFLFVIVFTAILTAFFMQEPLKIYLETKHHIEINLPQNIIFKKGSEFYEFLKQIFKNQAKNEPEIFVDENVSIDRNITILLTKELDSNLTQTHSKITLKSGDEVLFIGDSIMQSIAMNARKIFARRGVKVIDMSKHSTGLINKKYYDWQIASEQTLKNHKNIKLVVALFGANDSWGRTIAGKYRELNSTEWGEFYEKRVDEIFQIAKQNGVWLIWLGAPCMKNAEFSAKMVRLNEIFKTTSQRHNQNFIDLTEVVCQNGYITHINNEKNESVRVRANDGIHLSIEGGREAVIRMIDEIKFENNGSF